MSRIKIDRTKLGVHIFEPAHRFFILDMSHLKSTQERHNFVKNVERKYPNCICGCLKVNWGFNKCSA